ncbi:Crp/Fnr family transcriptional regulator [Aquincola sp. MAHUQ-54]|uniref:Crp/Fnr family transcriptional regulator n=1 Tax=Aquincola agrisoli TaxID=3119538 RepID=A0AAW9QHR2_9BURK
MIPWLRVLGPEDRARTVADLQLADAEPGERLCRIGRPAALWFGVIDGLLKMTNDDSVDAAITYSGLPPGAWFGEGTLLKRESYRYNIETLRRSVVAGLPIGTFEWLLERSIPFNRYLMNQLNERVSQFIAARETDRLTDPDTRVARSLGGLFHPVLFPGVGTVLRITQQELGYLVGLSRQRVNEALRALQSAGLIRIEYGGVQVLDLEGLRRYRPR